MNEAETKLDGTVPEEIFFIDGKWKITQKTAKDVNNLLKTIANKGNITYHIEWIP